MLLGDQDSVACPCDCSENSVALNEATSMTQPYSTKHPKFELIRQVGIPIYILTLLWGPQISRNARFLLTLTNRKGHQGSSPGGHNFVY